MLPMVTKPLMNCEVCKWSSTVKYIIVLFGTYYFEHFHIFFSSVLSPGYFKIDARNFADHVCVSHWHEVSCQKENGWYILNISFSLQVWAISCRLVGVQNFSFTQNVRYLLNFDR